MDQPLTLHIATDHAGFAHKNAVLKWLQDEGYHVVDHGAVEYNAADDFPEFIARAAAAVEVDPATSKAIIFGGSGQGEAMCANRFRHVRATVYYGGDEEIIRLSRLHNDANVLAIGARFVSLNETKRVVWLWLHTDALPAPHYQRRNEALTHLP